MILQWKQRRYYNGKDSQKKNLNFTKFLAVETFFATSRIPSAAVGSHYTSFMQFIRLRGSTWRYESCEITNLSVKFSDFSSCFSGKPWRWKFFGTFSGEKVTQSLFEVTQQKLNEISWPLRRGRLSKILSRCFKVCEKMKERRCLGAWGEALESTQSNKYIAHYVLSHCYWTCGKNGRN